MNKLFLGILLAAAVAVAGPSTRAEDRVPLSKVAHIHGIAIDPDHSGSLYLATHYGLFRLGPDGLAERISTTRDDFMGFTPHPTDPKVFFASGHPAGGGNLGVIRSSDGGVTWENLARGVNGPVDFHAMDISKGNPAVIYGMHGGLQASYDGGKSWAMVGPAPDGLMALAVGSKDASILYAATRTGLLISRDGGKAWKPTSLPPAPATMVDVTGDGTVYAYLYGYGLVRGTEGGSDWRNLGSIPGEHAILHFVAGKGILYGVREDSLVLRSEDGGQSWQALADRKAAGN